LKYYTEDNAIPVHRKYFIVAGEASGDLHASNLVKAIKRLQPGAEFAGFGGDLMAAAGVKILKHYREMDFMGFTEVIMNIRSIFRNLDHCKQGIIDYKPHTLILIDYPGFNLRIAPFAKALGIRVIYYISPQIWAWKQNRVYKIRQYVDKMLVILPFEEEFYGRFDMKVDFVGHPLLDALETEGGTADPAGFAERHGLPLKPVIALLPGSRRQEIRAKLPVMLKMIPHFPDHQFVIAGATSQPMEFYREITAGQPVNILSNATYDILRNSVAALVTSGTATLETALLGVPEVVCYKGSSISFAIAKRLVKVKFISLVNLIMDKEIVRELIQEDMNEQNLKSELEKILDPVYAGRLKNEYLELKERLGGPGASERAAKLVISV
jgi:lipid-A-disaccharide synthase